MRRLPILVGVALATFTACSTYRPANQPLDKVDRNAGYHLGRLSAQHSIGDVGLFLAFSGGGTRAAALAYGVLEELRDTEIAGETASPLELLERSMEQWTAELPQGPDGEPIKAYVVELAFDNLSDPEERDFFNNLDTSFVLTNKTIDRLRDVSRKLLRDSEPFQRLLTDLKSD